jgi:hypothetical protein
VADDLLDGPVRARDRARGSRAGNFTRATATLFVNPTAGDLHLTASATVVIDRGVPVTNLTDDWDGKARPIGSGYDIGADEYATKTGTGARSTQR